MSVELTFEEKYDALCRRDPEYVGLFTTAVKTTGVFCLPTCSARKPNRENVEFFSSPADAVRHGYRPCKKCRPLESPEQSPSDIQQLIRELENDAALRIRDSDLRERGVDPATVRRWFKRHHQMTFHGYQRMMRLNRAHAKLGRGVSVMDTAMDVGFDSVSGFSERFQAVVGTSPSRADAKSIIHLARFSTPLGAMFACATEHGICLCEFTDRRMLESEFIDLQKRLDAVILPATNHRHLEQLQEELGQYFAGQRKRFDVPLHTPTTEFRQSVWKCLLEIPYGETRSYAQQAELLGRPTAVRAVASANGQNRIAIVIPCHRVIGADGNLTGYAGGLARKRWLLDFEAGK
jgi:AraC family transcriptional regulator of adaptative response/methylated-DNA-[protein]-cysteine methyltransferase